MNAARRPFLALLLLACFLRVLAPEAWILALHQHAHTTEEPAHAPAFAHKGKALLSAKHQHCAVEQFYGRAFQLAVPVVVPGPLGPRTYVPVWRLLALRAAYWQPRGPALLRGPPAQA